jgi:hypothetical protein
VSAASRYSRTTALLLSIAIATAWSSSARADIDPASDVLLLQDVFLPYSPKVCSELSDTLENVIKQAKAAGFPVKVAIIASKRDLGGAAYLWANPNGYARFLGQELGIFGADVGRNFRTNLKLLVVMPQGASLYRSGVKAARPIKGVRLPSTGDSNKLARSATTLVVRLASEAGHPIPAPKIPAGCSTGGGGGGSSLLIFGAPLLLLILVGGFAALRWRKLGPSDTEPDDTRGLNS